MQPSSPQPTDERQGFYRSSQEQAGFMPSTPAVEPQTELQDDVVEQINYDPNEIVTWQASEYIHRSKDARWAIGFGSVTLIALVISILLRAWTFTALIVVMAVAMGVFAFRKPNVKQYTLSHQGLRIGERMYNLADFRAFGVMPEGAFFSALIIPSKRFMPAVTVYFSEQEAEQVVSILGTHLPLEDLHPDPIDMLMRRLHF